MKKDDINEKIKYKVNVDLTYKLYKDLNKIYQNKFWKNLIFISIIIIILFMLVFTRYNWTLKDYIVTIFPVICFVFIILKVTNCILVKYNYNKMTRKTSHYNFFVNFYENFLVVNRKNIKKQIKYEDIYKIKFTNNLVCIFINETEILPMTIDKCSEEVIKYIHKIDSLYVNHIIPKQSISNITKDESEFSIKTVKIILKILFWVTIFSVYFGLLIANSLIKINNAPSVLFFRYTYVFLFILPIPILSIILGLKYYKIPEVKSIKNVIAGCIMFFLLFVVGMSSFIYNFKIDLDNIYSYEQIMDVTLPKEKETYRVKWGSVLTEHTTSYIIFSNIAEANRFRDEIQLNNNWILKNNVSESLNKFIPNPTLCEGKDTECYYMVYIYETKSYNEIPNNLGAYNMYAFMYDYSTYTLTIHEYKYNRQH